MSKALALIALLVSAAPVRAAAWSPEGYPGSTWGTFGRDASGFEGNDAMGNVTQGVRWLTLPGKIGFETYGAYRWRYRTQNQTYFDAQGPAAGVGFDKGPFTAGVDLAWKSYPQLGRKDRTFVYYLDWYKAFDLMKAADVAPPDVLPGLGIPVSTWGTLTHDLDGIEGDGVMGWLKIGVRWFKIRKNIKAMTYGRYRVRSRSKENRFYNASGPSLGVELKLAPITLNVEYAWTTFEILRRETNDLRLEASWYLRWDLKDDILSQFSWR